MKNAVCAIFKDEAPYLREWVQFHRLQGFERFHLYNNESTDDWMPEVFDLISAGIVTIHDWPGKAQQIPAYKDFIQKCNREYKMYKWVGFFDIDEYMYGRSGRTVARILSDYNQYAAVEAGWIIFGTSGHKERPEGLTIDNYTMRSEINFKDNVDHVKSVVKPSRVVNFRDPHQLDVFGPTAKPTDLKINHYWCRSEEDLAHKYHRGRPDIPEKHSMDTVNRIISSTSAVKDETIKNFWSEPLRKSL
jgi:hypothetical protein